MELLSVSLIICGGPLLFFVMGWAACYLLVVKYRFHVERRFETPQPARGQRREAWEP